MFVWMFWGWVCGCRKPSDFTVVVEKEEAFRVFDVFVQNLKSDSFVVEVNDKGSQTCKKGQILLLEQQAQNECYKISSDQKCAVIEGDILGLQYGLSSLLEDMGFGFFHPYQTLHPTERLILPDRTTEWICPQMERRGIHLHTLHPIEGYFDMWEPDNHEGAYQIIDWVIKNKGNHLQWVSLEDMPVGWEEHTSLVVEEAHQRGITVGIGIQLFSDANLQKAFNLVSDIDADLRAQMENSFSKITPLDFDVYNLSFGEFLSSEPESFIASIDLAFEILQEQDPDAEMSTVMHVGKDLQVQYQGEDYIYYLLAQFANPEITPWVHSVMFYNLYDSAGGAYHHEDFREHRAYIESKLEAQERVAYFPESAYWVAFDNSVPQFFPVYVYSRWKDMYELEGLKRHILFSSGWEWGYWLNDVMTLRMNWEVPESYSILLEQVLQPIGEEDLADQISELAELQREYLIDRELSPWVAGVDIAHEVGYNFGIVAQPHRPLFSELSEEHLEIAYALEELSQKTETIFFQMKTTSPWSQEIADGIEIDFLRAMYMAKLIKAVVNEDNSKLMEAEDILMQAEMVVENRHKNLWDPQPERLISVKENSTLYDFGYLLRSDELCFWERERIQVSNMLTDSIETVPGCQLE